MKWVTREHAKVDRIACPWLIFRFIDEDPELQFVPADEVMAVAERDGAIPFDVPGVELGHKNGQCSFEAFIDKYCLDDPALNRLALIVRAADTSDTDAAPEGAGLRAAATGFSLMGCDDFALMELEFPLYDALYNWCKQQVGNG
jgi:hypothetical protein